MSTPLTFEVVNRAVEEWCTLRVNDEPTDPVPAYARSWMKTLAKFQEVLKFGTYFLKAHPGYTLVSLTVSNHTVNGLPVWGTQPLKSVALSRHLIVGALRAHDRGVSANLPVSAVLESDLKAAVTGQGQELEDFTLLHVCIAAPPGRGGGQPALWLTKPRARGWTAGGAWWLSFRISRLIVTLARSKVAVAASDGAAAADADAEDPDDITVVGDMPTMREGPGEDSAELPAAAPRPPAAEITRRGSTAEPDRRPGELAALFEVLPELIDDVADDSDDDIIVSPGSPAAPGDGQSPVQSPDAAVYLGSTADLSLVRNTQSGMGGPHFFTVIPHDDLTMLMEDEHTWAGKKLAKRARMDGPGVPPRGNGPDRTTPIERLWSPGISLVVPILRELFSSPLRPTSKAFATMIEDFSRGRMSVTPFMELRGKLVREKTMLPPYQYPASLAPARTYRVLCVRTALEAALLRAKAAGRVDEALLSDHRLDVLVCSDSAGKRINGMKVWILSLLPLCMRQPGALDATVPICASFGPFRDAHRRAVMTEIAPMLAGLARTEIYVGTHKLSVELINVSDLADTWAAYTHESLPSARLASFVDRDVRGHSFFTVRPCPSCAASLRDICALPPVAQYPPRTRLPILRGANIPLRHIYGRMHALIHGLPVVLGTIIMLLWRRAAADADTAGGNGEQLRLVVRWLGTAFPRRGGFDPVPEMYAADPLLEGDDDDRDTAQPVPLRYETEKPRSSTRAKDVKTFLTPRSSSALPGGNRFVFEITALPPRGASVNYEDVVALLKTPAVQRISLRAPIGSAHTAPMPDLATFFQACADYVLQLLHPDPLILGPEASRREVEARGRACFHQLKVITAMTEPWTYDPATGQAWPWVQRLDDAARGQVADALRGQFFHYSRVPLGVAAHLAFEHGVDMYDFLPYVPASRATEEAFDHFFAYIYDLSDAMMRRPNALTEQSAFALWSLIVEAHVAGAPLQTTRGRDARGVNVVNRSYA